MLWDREVRDVEGISVRLGGLSALSGAAGLG